MPIHKIHNNTTVKRVINQMFIHAGDTRELGFVTENARGKKAGSVYRILKGQLRFKYNNINMSEERFIKTVIEEKVKYIDTLVDKHQ